MEIVHELFHEFYLSGTVKSASGEASLVEAAPILSFLLSQPDPLPGGRDPAGQSAEIRLSVCAGTNSTGRLLLALLPA